MECTNPNGCSLDSSEMVERVTAWREVSSYAISREVHSDRITSVYPSDPELNGRLKELIAAEAICCSFLKFNVQERDDQTVVELTFPKEARSLVESVIALPAEAASPELATRA